MAILPLLVLLKIYHLGKSLSIPSVFQASTSESPNLTLRMTSIWISHRPWIDTLPRVCGMLPTGYPPPYDLLHPWLIRGFPRTQLGYKDCMVRWMISSRISL